MDRDPGPDAPGSGAQVTSPKRQSMQEVPEETTINGSTGRYRCYASPLCGTLQTAIERNADEGDNLSQPDVRNFAQDPGNIGQ